MWCLARIGPKGSRSRPYVAVTTWPSLQPLAHAVPSPPSPPEAKMFSARGSMSAHASRGHRVACATLAMMASIVLVGCDTDRPSVTTEPLAKAEIDAFRDAAPLTAETFETSAFTEDNARSTTLGGPLEGLDAADLARFNDGLDEFQEIETV